MEKITSLFKRDYEGTRLVYNEVVPGAEWVLAGEGVATIKWDGTAVRILDGEMWKRYTLRRGKTPPDHFAPAAEIDERTGKQEGWVPVSDDDPADRWHIEAHDPHLDDGTYELIGPKIQDGAEGVPHHQLVRHGLHELPNAPRTFDGLRDFLDGGWIEGIVWHHPDGRMVKIKAKDFGVSRWPPGAPWWAAK